MTSSLKPTPNSNPEDMCLTLDESQDNKGTLGEQGWIAPHRQESRQGSTHICKYYRRGGYRYGVMGRDCNFSHPKACPRFVTHGPFGDKGCKLGMKCSIFHPTACRSSVSTCKCFSETCCYLYIKGTKRRDAPPQDNSYNGAQSRTPPQAPASGTPMHPDSGQP